MGRHLGALNHRWNCTGSERRSSKEYNCSEGREGYGSRVHYTMATIPTPAILPISAAATHARESILPAVSRRAGSTLLQRWMGSIIIYRTPSINQSINSLDSFDIRVSEAESVWKGECHIQKNEDCIVTAISENDTVLPYSAHHSIIDLDPLTYRMRVGEWNRGWTSHTTISGTRIRRARENFCSWLRDWKQIGTNIYQTIWKNQTTSQVCGIIYPWNTNVQLTILTLLANILPIASQQLKRRKQQMDEK